MTFFNPARARIAGKGQHYFHCPYFYIKKEAMTSEINSLELQAIELYRRGLSIRDIADRLYTNKSSVGRWVKDVERYIEDDIYPVLTINKAFVALLRQLQSNSFNLGPEFHKALSMILIELLLDLMHGLGEDGYCSLERDILSRLGYILNNNVDTETAQELLNSDLAEAIEFYGINVE